MSDDGTYNGWKNYPTWAVNLWLTNDQGSYDWLTEITSEEYDDAPNCLNVTHNVWTLDEARKFNLADRLREEVEEMSVQDGQEASMYSDLLGYALQEVDWNEIAAHALNAWAEGLEYA